MSEPTKICPQFYNVDMDIRHDTLSGGDVALMWDCPDCDWEEPLTDGEELQYYEAQETP